MRTFLEFFAGGGMARAGLGQDWLCLFANDFDPAKTAAYAANWGLEDFVEADIATLGLNDLPRARADLAWASFPCQDLSVAGARGGLAGGRSGTFWPFWRLIQDLEHVGRGPRMVVIENVPGLLTSNGGADFQALANAIAAAGYGFTAAVIDAAWFTPQSRPRLFVVCYRPDYAPPSRRGADPVWAPMTLTRAIDRLGPKARARFQWPDLPPPPMRNRALKDVIETEPTGVAWFTPKQTADVLRMMSPLHMAKVKTALAAGGVQVGAIFRRTRTDAAGQKRQCAEVRFDGVAGCLRTPAGGSSRQTILVVEGDLVRTRLLSPREAARLMGLSDDYVLPAKLNPALHLLGDGVVAPAVRFLAERLLEPALAEAVSA